MGGIFQPPNVPRRAGLIQTKGIQWITKGVKMSRA